MVAAMMILTNGAEPPSAEELAKPGAVYLARHIPAGGLAEFRCDKSVRAALAEGLPVVAMFDDAADAAHLNREIAAAAGAA